ncbi:MAG: gamma-glutamyltransferase [Solirubrobacterales bacterium]|nr:gamma-glutamyltransferase [Solirubrobacterales bacterium]
MSRFRGVVAAGHPLTAGAGAEVLREGGNAVDAAIAAVLASFVCESPLTGLGAGGFMLVHSPSSNELIDFFCAAPGLDGAELGAELVGVPVHFDETTNQVFYVGAASCAVPGNPAGIEMAARRHGSAPLDELAAGAARLAREGVVVNAVQAYLFEILESILTRTPEGAALYAPGGRPLREGETFVYPDLGDALERFGAEGAEPFYRGEIASEIDAWIRGRGGVLGLLDLERYRPVEREPARVSFRGAEVLTNPPPSSGGILVAFALGLLERLGEGSDLGRVVAASEAANASRGEEFDAGLRSDGFAERFLAAERLDEVAEQIAAGGWIGGPGAPGEGPAGRLGSTTHISVLDAEGMCASVTCSNGACSGEIVPGTGVHLNNMLGEEDLNPGGFHRIPPGLRVPSMMSPTAVLRDGRVALALGSAGSNRIRSAILQTALRVIEDGMPADEAVRAPRIHSEDGTVQAEPGVDPEGLDRLEARGVPVVRWPHQNLYFGGCQAVVLDPSSGQVSGGGDPRRGGAVALA